MLFNHFIIIENLLHKMNLSRITYTHMLIFLLKNNTHKLFNEKHTNVSYIPCLWNL